MGIVSLGIVFYKYEINLLRELGKCNSSDVECMLAPGTVLH